MCLMRNGLSLTQVEFRVLQKICFPAFSFVMTVLLFRMALIEPR